MLKPKFVLKKGCFSLCVVVAVCFGFVFVFGGMLLLLLLLMNLLLLVLDTRFVVRRRKSFVCFEGRSDLDSGTEILLPLFFRLRVESMM
jgi:hypothetical protein